jgi:hypothetical protein
MVTRVVRAGCARAMGFVFALVSGGGCGGAQSPAAGPPPAGQTTALAAPPPAVTVAEARRGASEQLTASPTVGAPEPGGASGPGVDTISVTVTNPLAFPRASETIALKLSDLRRIAPALDLKTTRIVDAAEAPVLSQLVDTDRDESPDEIVFQADLGASESKAFRIQVGPRRLPARSDFKVYGRFVRERHDDFAWENDLVAHRVYGPELEKWPKEALTSSGIDTWAKRVSRLLVNDWYMTDDYHQDSGEGADFYSVGKSRGCGGVGIWAGGKLQVSRNFRTSRVLANGPIRLIFELDYEAWEAGGTRVAETKRVTLDAGTHFNRIESVLTGQRGALAVGIGIAKHESGVRRIDTRSAVMTTWEPLNGGKSGHLGCAVVLPPGSGAESQETASDFLIVTPAPANGHLVYLTGSAWDATGQVTSADAWSAEAAKQSSQLGAPVQVALAAIAAK